jgi:hypothetical protein
MSARPILKLSRPSPRFQQPPKPPRSPDPGPVDAPAGWWEHAKAARALSGLPLAGLPASPQAPVRALIGMGLGGMAGMLKAAGVAPDAALLTAKALRRYRKSAAYSRACLAPGAVVVDLLTGEGAGPVNEHQQAAASCRLNKCGIGARQRPDPAMPTNEEPR